MRKEALQPVKSSKEETPSEIVKRKLKPTKDLTQLKNELIDWLNKNPALFIPQHERGHVILMLSLIIDKIHEWGEVKDIRKDIEQLQ